MSVTNSGFAKRGIADCRQDFVTCWEPSKNERKSTSGTSPITLRVTKTVLEGGVEEILVSSSITAIRPGRKFSRVGLDRKNPTNQNYK